ncbi:hypothetical protein FRC14_000896 [Serendipita sp. 396]|nr:hypothetical protein FRC14_000896 [Serendipita sp. 396]KAG8785769.1 hypothetical protein FRC15_000727 [Serendipita sp. 397]KAG8801262.1 hypothetical protein FRC16_000884 [Serendipita sp. 398]KAG8858159.1 hypothetical protein FRB91_010237 [Serendipita sp. 411]KAG8869668.1 hypothetical protein FRC20_001111 [Serendipita sp. 405]
MSLLPVVNSGIYKIVHFAYGAIRNDDGALGAKGNSSSPELEWRITRNQDHTYSFHVHDPKNPSAIGVAAHPGGTISEVKQRFYISVEGALGASTHWRLQAVSFGSEPRILYAIYQDPRDNQGHCQTIGHWELNSGDKKEPVKLNRDPADDENKHVPQNYSAQALWLLEPVAVPLPVNPPPAGY